MRTIKRTGRFKRDYKREGKSKHRATLDRDLTAVVTLLVADTPLPERYRDHALTGDWSDHRDCHIRPDLLLIYRRPDANTLELVRLGSHSELSLLDPASAAYCLGPEIGTMVEGLGVPRIGDDARHAQGLRKLPRHIPRLAFRASSSAST